MDYKQPDFYHFSEDAIQLAHFVKDYLLHSVTDKNLNHSLNIADFGCGSGVVGIELTRDLVLPVNIFFVERQPVFIPYIKANCKQFIHGSCYYSIINCSWIELQQKFNVIVSNPPYFIEGNGRPSPNPNKQQCRAFSAAEAQGFIISIERCLDRSGRAFVLGRNELGTLLLSSNLVMLSKTSCSGGFIYCLAKQD